MSVQHDIEPRDMVYGGLWKVIRVPVPGPTVERVEAKSSDDTRFSIGFFGAPITAGQLSHIVGDPLTDADAWQRRPETLDACKFIESWGNATTPASGEFVDTTGVDLGPNTTNVWVAIFAEDSCVVHVKLVSSGTIEGVPNQPKDGTRARAFRMADEVFEKADEKAKAAGETVSDVVRRALEEYVKDEEKS